MTVTTLSRTDFINFCTELKLTDNNIEELKNYCFISICCAPICANYGLEKYGEVDGHYFKTNHQNVLNVDFDDVDEDGTYESVQCYAINERQAIKMFEFIEKNKDKNFVIHCRAGKSRSRAVGVFIIENYGHEPNLSFGNDLSDRGNCTVLAMLNRQIRKKIDEND